MSQSSSKNGVFLGSLERLKVCRELGAEVFGAGGGGLPWESHAVVAGFLLYEFADGQAFLAGSSPASLRSEMV